jgi:hypothetical protein
LFDKNPVQVDMPSAKKMGPIKINCPITAFIISDPGIGRLLLFNKTYFYAQYINIKPNIEKTEIIGCKVTKKQVKRNKFIT